MCVHPVQSVLQTIRAKAIRIVLQAADSALNRIVGDDLRSGKVMYSQQQLNPKTFYE